MDERRRDELEQYEIMRKMPEWCPYPKGGAKGHRFPKDTAEGYWCYCGAYVRKADALYGAERR